MMKYVPRRKGERVSVWMDLGDKHGRQTPERSYENEPEEESDDE